MAALHWDAPREVTAMTSPVDRDEREQTGNVAVGGASNGSPGAALDFHTVEDQWSDRSHNLRGTHHEQHHHACHRRARGLHH